MLLEDRQHLARTQSMHAFSRERLLKLFTSAPGAFWRFDVDIDLSAAVRMARFAQVAGISGTFYLNPRCDFYNIFSDEGHGAVDAIERCGHRIGIHVDYRDIGRVEQVVSRDLMLMRAGFPGRFQGDPDVSFHMPPETVLWRDIEWFASAYAARWEGHYVSDSRGRPITVEVTDDMQVCLHPEHWAL